MNKTSLRKRILGWYFFDWASQPYHTLLLTFIFGPYIKEILGDGAAAQAAWGYTIGAAGLLIAVMAPFLGAVADRGGRRIGWIRFFSILTILGAASVWLADPSGFNLGLVLLLFGLGIVGTEFSTIFTNSLLPGLGSRDEIGRISGSGWAFGYVGGLLALVITLLCLAENGDGLTLLGRPAVFGLDPDAREGTRFVGPFTALWYVVFMVPFFLWVRETDPARQLPMRVAIREAWPDLRQTLVRLPRTPSLFAFLAASMFYRDALNGLYVFGGLFAAGVLGWSVVDTGVFGILAVVTAALFAWIGGKADSRFGPKPVILVSLVMLTAISIVVVFVSRDSILWIAVPAGSRAPDLFFYAFGACIGAAGGAMQSASRTMVCRQGDPEHMTQTFGLYALTGKATAFLAPLSIGLVTDLTGSQHFGITPLIVLFLLGLVLLSWVKPEGERAV